MKKVIAYLPMCMCVLMLLLIHGTVARIIMLLYVGMLMGVVKILCNKLIKETHEPNERKKL